MEPIHALLLGAVQGLTEFLPVSSSAHLIFLPSLLGWAPFEQQLAFDVALHLGTLLALIAYFRRDWLLLAQATFRLTRRPAEAADPTRLRSEGLLLMLLVGSLPAALAGLLLDDFIEERLRSPALAAVTLIAFALLLALAERRGGQRLSLEGVRWRHTVAVGLAQALALIPGVSRSGVTITAGLFTGLDRATAARFSFLLGTPVTFGAALVKVPGLLASDLTTQELTAVVLGVASAAVVGLLSIHVLLRYVQTRSYNVFVLYRLIVGGLVLLVLAVR